VHGRLTVRQGVMYSIQYFSLYLIAILYIISIKVKTNDFHEFSALSQLETAVEPKPRLVVTDLAQSRLNMEIAVVATTSWWLAESRQH
jgi:hypothetical protein